MAGGMRHAESDELTFLWGERVMQSILSVILTLPTSCILFHAIFY